VAYPDLIKPISKTRAGAFKKIINKQGSRLIPGKGLNKLMLRAGTTQ